MIKFLFSIIKERFSICYQIVMKNHKKKFLCECFCTIYVNKSAALWIKWKEAHAQIFAKYKNSRCLFNQMNYWRNTNCFGNTLCDCSMYLYIVFFFRFTLDVNKKVIYLYVWPSPLVLVSGIQLIMSTVNLPMVKQRIFRSGILGKYQNVPPLKL